MIFAAREYPSSKNHETPFREEIGFEALRTDGVELLLPIPAKGVAEFLCDGYFRHRKMPQHSLSSTFRISGNQ
jgi:hypothetical protein